MAASSYFAFRMNGSGDTRWVVATWMVSVVPLWTFIAKYSKNLVADAVIYDTLVTVTYFLVLLVLTKQVGVIRWWQVLGFLMALGGSFLVKLR